MDDITNTDIVKEGRSGLGWLSINRYGAVCLNSTKVFFGDIDCIASKRNPNKAVVSFEHAAIAISAVGKKYGLCFRVYRTAAGVRVIELSQTHEPKADRTLEILAALDGDRAYTALTKYLNNFRVRLTPKPWRIGKRRTLPEFTTIEAFDEYVATQKEYRIAMYVGTLGISTTSIPDEVAYIVDLHDKACAINLPVTLV